MRERLVHRLRERRLPPPGLIILGLATWLGLGLLAKAAFHAVG